MCIAKCTVFEPIVHFTLESFSPVAAGEVTERVDSAWEEQRKDKSTYRRQFGHPPLFEGPPDPRVQEEVVEMMSFQIAPRYVTS